MSPYLNLARCLLALFASALPFTAIAAAPSEAPVRALLITGGCCHDYPYQSKAFIEGMKRFGNVTWTVVNEGGNGTQGKISLYDNPDWAKPYDVIVHNECFADTDEPGYLRKITTAHRAGKPAVVIHCAMHSYRAAQVDHWREFLGVTSRRHDHQGSYSVLPLMPGHPALKSFPVKWTTPQDELYVIEKLWPNATALATSASAEDGKFHPVVWCNDYHGTRVFGTTFGHGNVTWDDPTFIALIAQGLLWAAGRDR